MKQIEGDPWVSIEERFLPGQRVQGKVRNLTDFGAFVEIEEGVDGLVHVSDMSWTRRVKHPSEIVKKGDDVEAVITAIDPENRRVSLSIKEFQPNDWETFKQRHQVGDVVEGVVTRIADFGVFVQIEGLVEGLMHVSETTLPRGARPQDFYQDGQTVRARILRIEDAEMKIGLSAVGADESAAPSEPAASVPAAAPVAEAAAEPEAPAPAEAPKKKRTRKKAEPEAPSE
jgi:small subunit ribosomal protein S1